MDSLSNISAGVQYFGPVRLTNSVLVARLESMTSDSDCACAGYNRSWA